MTQTRQFLAHVRQNANGEWQEHSLDEHLREVSRLAGEFGNSFDSAGWAALAGLWHDLGKFGLPFQNYIKKTSGYDPDAHLEGAAGRVDHSTAGALQALAVFGDSPHARTLSYLIAGHHAGLPDWDGETSSLFQRVENGKIKGLLDQALAGSVPAGLLAAKKPTGEPLGGKGGYALWVRMLFSCVADADFLDTEAFMSPEKKALRGVYPDIADLLPAFDRYMAEKAAAAPDTPVNRLRADILRRCWSQAALAPGFFSLTVPTGGGKTLSSLAFALEHAKAHGKRRVIYAIPYTSIIEQTAGEFKKIWADRDVVVEHHSNLDPDKETRQSRLAAENWDAPLVVTTNVQFFESLFAARTSRCRKLHNIVDSIVVLDEAQMLPPEFLSPILATMKLLAAHYGVTFVLCTATQPALEHRHDFREGLDGVREIVENPAALYEAFRRVRVKLPESREPESWEVLAEKLRAHDRVLAIVNRRDDCRELHRLMPKGTVHLSALMCGEHRSQVIGEIKAKLKNGAPVRVVSTQLVEAGVDLDFPVVYRAFAGLDSIAQAAGRCNREGRLEGLGEVVVFNPLKPSPAGLLRKAEQAARELLHGNEADPLAPEWFERYFCLLFWSLNSRDKEGILTLLQAERCQVQFREAAAKFQLIPERDLPVIVRYGAGAELMDLLEAKGPETWLLRKLQRYVVTVPQRVHKEMLGGGDIREAWPGFFVQAVDGLYHPELGLQAGGDVVLDPAACIVDQQ